MKFSDIEQDKWEQLKPYLDTCLLPVTGLTGYENPLEATARLEELRDALDCLEKPYYGRMITYPALHYTNARDAEQVINELVSKLKETGFKYVVVMTVQADLRESHVDQPDLFICIDPKKLYESPQEVRESLNKKVSQMWRTVI